MADIFVSYTASDRDWAFWLAAELRELGHAPRIHEWEIQSGGDIYAWMEAHHDAADHVLCVVSDEYLKAPYSSLERNAALWQAASTRPGFVLLVVVKQCRLPTLSDHMRRCDLFDLPEDAARLRLRAFLETRSAPTTVPFPGKVVAVSNIPIRVPAHFLGREDALAAIEAALGRYEGRVAITALHGLRGVGKTTLAAAYAGRHRGDYRATWWIRAQSEPTMRADLVALGVRLGWVPADEKEEPALAAVMERLRHEGEGILLIFDNATDADALKPYLPRGGATQVLVTSNAPAWRGVAEPVETRLWPKEIGADYLVARTDRESEREAAAELSEALGGLPLAHEQAAAYCERLEIGLAEYRRRFAAAPVQMLDTRRDAPAEYHDKLTVAKTFALAIEEGAKLHPAAEPLLVHAALLAPEAIPLFLFAEAQEKFGEPLASGLAGDGLDEAVAALRAFALIDRETIIDERDPAITTDTIRLHRLVREIAAARSVGEAREAARRALIEAVAIVFPQDDDDPQVWPRARRLQDVATAMVGGDAVLPSGAEFSAPHLLSRLSWFEQRAIGDYRAARQLRERALRIQEKTFGPDHPLLIGFLGDLGLLAQVQGDLVAAQVLFQRELTITEKTFGPKDLSIATSLHNLAALHRARGDLPAAQRLSERALMIWERSLGPEHHHVAAGLSNLALVLEERGELTAALPLLKRALVILENQIGLDHPDTAVALHNLARIFLKQGDHAAAQPCMERALAICEKVLGPEHPDTAMKLNGLAFLFQAQGDLAGARRLFERALAIKEKALGAEHPDTGAALRNLADLLRAQGDLAGSRPLFERALAITEKTHGPEHVDVGITLNSLAGLLWQQGDLDGARSLLERVVAIAENARGLDHPETATILDSLGRLLEVQGDPAGARQLYERALAIRERALGPDDPLTAESLNRLAFLLQDQHDVARARSFFERVLAIYEKTQGREHPAVATALNNLGYLLQIHGDFGGARPFHERALAIREKMLHPEHADTATSLNNLGTSLLMQRDRVGARPLLERALANCEKTLGPEHVVTADTLYNLAAAQDDSNKICLLLQRVVAIYEKVLGPDHSRTSEVRGMLLGLQRGP